MTVNIGDIIRITAHTLLGTVDPFVNTFHCQWVFTDGVTDDFAMDKIAESIDTAYLLINAQVSDLISYVDIQGQNLTKSVLLPTKAWPTLTVGANTGALLPPQTCGYVFYRTTRPKTRASIYFAGFTELSNTVSGNPDAPITAALQAFGDFAVAGFPLVITNLAYGAYNRPLDRFTPVNAAIVSAKWRTQRRRVRGVEL